MSSAEARPFSTRGLLVAALAALGLASAWIATLPSSPTYGWDESMHVALPAARLRLALAAGEFGLAWDALLDCAQYPFVQPVALALVQGVFGATERVARAFGIVEWCATLFGVFVLARIVIESLEPERRPPAAVLAPWLAFAFAALSPLALGFAGTLFLETPSACAGVWALVAWLWLWRAPTRGRALLAGTLATIALFTKWNYGLLLGAALALDLAWRLGERAGRAERLRVLIPLAMPPLVLCVWWFVLPVPGGAAVAEEHRSAFASFLAGNQDFARVAVSRRVFCATGLLSVSPRMALLALCGVAFALAHWRAPAGRMLILVIVATWVPVWTHPFFQERFLIPGVVFVWVFGAVGLSTRLSCGAKGVTVAAGLLLAAWWPLSDSPRIPVDTRIVGEACGVIAGPEAVREYVVSEIARHRSLGSGRALDSSGLETGAAHALLDAIANEVGPDERCGWIGMSSELSPAALHLGLLERGGSGSRLLRDAPVRMDLDYFADPHADLAAVKSHAARFDVVFATDPPDLKGRSAREWARAARELLIQDGAWTARELGRFEIARPMKDPLVVTLFACRPRK